MDNKINFVHLHLHSEYSLLDGACKLDELVEEVSKREEKSVAVTDHGCMYGCMEFYKKAIKKGVKPIIGCEVYVAARTRFDKVFKYDKEMYHLVLLCKTNEGYRNLSKLVSLGYTQGFYRKPRVDKDILKKYSKGLIALSACIAGEVPRLLLNVDYEKAKKTTLEYKEIFGEDNFYIEIQNHGLEDQLRVLPLLINLAKETNTPLVATNDCHYLKREDTKMHKALLCIQTNHTLDEENSFEFGSDEFYLKSAEQMYELFKEYPEALENTVKIANRCNVSFEFGKTILPHFELESGEDHYIYMRRVCNNALKEKYKGKITKEIEERLKFELDTIRNMGYVDYFLIVHDFIMYAKNNGIAVGPGRGSGAGSIVAYLMGITDVDPIKYNLIFERFLNPQRVSMPDFDIDFCYENRQRVIEYVIEKYGSDHVAQIITFGTMAARAAIRDIGRVMSMPYKEVDVIAKLIPMELNMTISRALKISDELRLMYDSDSKIKELIDMALRIEGMPRQASTHAAGIVITKEPVDYYVPLAKNNDSTVTQYTMTLLEELGLLKMDFLGLRTLTVLQYAKEMIGGKEDCFSVETIDTSDKAVYQMLSKGETIGVFQFESAGMRNVMTRLKPENIEDLIAVIALYRPGPMDSIPKYIENRHNPDKVTYITPQLKSILDVTYGCIVYQEQVMQIFRTLAGYSLGRADIVRRAMAKKKHEIMEVEKKIFVEGLVDENGNIEVKGCLRNGIKREIAYEILSQMESFASYAFNKSHAAAYALISYQTAYLKCHYPKEYMAALLSSVRDFTDKVTLYIEECKNMGIKVLAPDVNESEKGFTVYKDGIRFSLLALKSVGEVFIDGLIKERNENGYFKSLNDFCERMYDKGINKKILESFIQSGAFDSIGKNRRQMLEGYHLILESINKEANANIEGQFSLFEMVGQDEDNEVVLPEKEEFSKDERLAREKEILGIYISGHPLDKYREMFNKMDYTYFSEVYENDESNRKVKDNSVI
ncbi:MAG: DNA polymerase III subunit alpha, partial [Clostridia bacterium]|nr:DNA polymerase III subunit alpha [Clostridia bacterium]